MTCSAYWKVFMKTFVDAVGKATRYYLKLYRRALVDQQRFIGPSKISSAFEVFKSSGEQRSKLVKKLKNLEAAHRELDGKVPAIPSKFSRLQREKAVEPEDESDSKSVDEYGQY
jgi:hypothetical protein